MEVSFVFETSIKFWHGPLNGLGWQTCQNCMVCLSATSYHTSVKTGDVRGAGTDASVYIKIFGEKGDTGTLWLKSSETTKNKFERARTDVFKLEAHDIGKVSQIVFL